MVYAEKLSGGKLGRALDYSEGVEKAQQMKTLVTLDHLFSMHLSKAA
ncbi:MAG: hypothetical protein PHO32_07650 [Candidatus Cloacimonetes bacterium]|nr:hypothetical protein [Candidatus Cloacimonadota bacterium]